MPTSSFTLNQIFRMVKNVEKTKYFRFRKTCGDLKNDMPENWKKALDKTQTCSDETVAIIDSFFQNDISKERCATIKALLEKVYDKTEIEIATAPSPPPITQSPPPAALGLDIEPSSQSTETQDPPLNPTGRRQRYSKQLSVLKASFAQRRVRATLAAHALRSRFPRMSSKSSANSIMLYKEFDEFPLTDAPYEEESDLLLASRNVVRTINLMRAFFEKM